MQHIIRELEDKRDGARAGGGARRVEVQHSARRLIAWRRE